MNVEPIRSMQPSVLSYLLITTLWSANVTEHEILPESFHQSLEAWWCHDTSMALSGDTINAFSTLYIYIYCRSDKQMWPPAKWQQQSSPADRTEEMDVGMREGGATGESQLPHGEERPVAHGSPWHKWGSQTGKQHECMRWVGLCLHVNTVSSI